MPKIKICFLSFLLLIVSSCNPITNIKDENENLVNKVNAIDSQWVNYDGLTEQDNMMVQSQFIPYNASEDYFLNIDAYVSYYNGGNFIKTELHEGNKSEVQSVEEADGVILSFNKENKSGIKLVRID